MFERFTDAARRVIVLAQEEARQLNHAYIGTEHILLGLLHRENVDQSTAATILNLLGLDLTAAEGHVKDMIGVGTDSPGDHLLFTPRAKKVLELSLQEAMGLRHSHVGTEHLLLGLIGEGEGVAAQVLHRHGLVLEDVRSAVMDHALAHPDAVETSSTDAIISLPADGPTGPACPHCRADLIDQTHVHAVSADGADVRFVCCARCGTVIGVLPG